MYASKHPELFSSAKSSRPEPGSWIPSMINLDDPLHKRRRNLVNRGFTVRRVADHEAKLRALCDELIDAVSERGECDFVADIARWVPMVVIGDMLGVAPEDRGMLLRWSDEMLGGGEAASIEDGAAAAARARPGDGRGVPALCAGRDRRPPQARAHRRPDEHPRPLGARRRPARRGGDPPGEPA